MTKLPYEMVMWLDPGKTTGYAAYGQNVFTSGQADFHTTGEIVEANARYHGSSFAAGCEMFIVTASGSQKADPEFSLKTIGMVEWLCHRHGAVLLTEVPSESRNLGRAGGKLEKLGWHKPGQDHANDAAAHLLSWLFREGCVPTTLLDRLFST